MTSARATSRDQTGRGAIGLSPKGANCAPNPGNTRAATLRTAFSAHRDKISIALRAFLRYSIPQSPATVAGWRSYGKSRVELCLADSIKLWNDLIRPSTPSCFQGTVLTCYEIVRMALSNWS